MFEAIQHRPVYWDDMKLHRSPTLPRGGKNRDWIKCEQRVAREHDTIDAAIAYAKRILAQRPGCPVEIINRGKPYTRVAMVQRDALGRTWCDSFDDHGLI